ncbi:nitrilase and fragile histidine triad fusion protein NitFhit-like isoform X2 [Gigantopelta aegis]|uniref:nitrilase and fragile histidine triad fusion protein NitFhit-like isoform X2 n=1 Tax=Gigantopelta aegis TaxID=1735272 RepID=UPI001B88E5AA|nr:nitrilase and fragile histidine triad fusion protein NitFhit-like isoform X2 [Gigantopelta aegis]
MIAVAFGFVTRKVTAVAVGRCVHQTRNMTTSLKVNPVVAVCQMTSTSDKTTNFQTCLSLIQRARQKGATLVCLPEACDYIAESKELSVKMSEPLDGSTVSKFKQAAIDNGVWLSVGGYHQKVSDTANRVSNTHLLISSDGQIKATYNKSHLFDLDIAGKVRLCESDYTVPGKAITPPVETPVGNIGLETCYDLRFPEMSIALAQQGAHILAFPSAFTQTTGMAHWEVLLRSRAIETQCYVLAAAQTGKHNTKRSSYGHAMIVDPWGCVIAQCKEGVDVCTAEIDLEYLEKIRQDMPVWQHRRHDLYGRIVTTSTGDVDSTEIYQFGQYPVKSASVFYRSALSYAFVNIKPVVPGHVLVASVRHAERFSDLTTAEVSDLFCVVQKVSAAVERQNGATSVTIAVQDGAEAGQTVQHVHVHVLPRKAGDFEENDDIYNELQKHDSEIDLESRRNLRTEESMQSEAKELRQHFS